MDDRGWVYGIEEQLDRLFTYCFETDYLQTYIYPSAITSIQYLLAQKPLDISATISSLRSALEAMFARYYSSAQVEITSDAWSSSNVTNSVTLVITITVTYQSVEYSVGKAIQARDSVFSIVENLNNTGSA
jgi:hypothetical protein